MAGVDGEARVVGVERRAVVGVIRRCGVDPDVGLEASEERLGLGELAVVVLIGVGRVGGREDDLQLARVLAPGGEEAVVRQGDGGVVLATRRVHGVVERRGDLLPEGGRRVQEVQVDVAMRGDRAENLQPGGRQAREAQDREAVREVGELRLVPEALAGGGEALGRARDLEVRTQPTPQLRLPAGVVGQAGVVPRGPPRQHLRPVQRVAIEEPCDVPHRAEPPPGALEVCVEGAEPGLVAVLVDHLQQRPHRTTGTPRVLVGVDARRGSQRALDDPAWRRERHVGADPVLAIGRRAEVERQPLCDPPLDALGRHGDDLGRERIRERGGEGLAEGVDEGVGAGGSVEVEHRSEGSLPDQPRPPGGAFPDGRSSDANVGLTRR